MRWIEYRRPPRKWPSFFYMTLRFFCRSSQNQWIWDFLGFQNCQKFLLGFLLHPRYFLTKLKKCVSPALKSFWWSIWYCNCYHSIPLDLRNMKNNYNIFQKCIDRDPESKNQTQYFFKKAFFEDLKILCKIYSLQKKSFIKKY